MSHVAGSYTCAAFRAIFGGFASKFWASNMFIIVPASPVGHFLDQLETDRSFVGNET